jgi:predicted MFS family arabinose efflux permease
MTLLQAIVSLAIFAPGVLAPLAGVDALALGLFMAAMFAVSTFTTIWGGVLSARFGSMRIASFCLASVAVAMAIAILGPSTWVVVVVGLVLGCAAGPETPASSALLGRLVDDRRRPFVFSLRQTGTQLGAMLGSLTLPAIALAWGSTGAYTVIAATAILGIFAFELMRPRYDAPRKDAPRQMSVANAMMLLRHHRGLALLAMVGTPYVAMQMVLNTFFVSYATNNLGQGLAAAGLLLAGSQAGGVTGRVGWGVLVTLGVRPRHVIAGLGFAMAAAALATVLIGATLPFPVLAVLIFLFGLCASGWNGVYLAEVARLSPPGRAGEATGAVFVTCYIGLVLGLLLFSAAASIGGLALGYMLVAASCVAVAIMLLLAAKEFDHG